MTYPTDRLYKYPPLLLYDSREKFFASSLEGQTDIVYGHIAAEGKDIYLQFWLWYERDWSPLPWRRGHVGDWEMIQLRLTPDGWDESIYAQHAGGEAQLYEWSYKSGQDQPEVFVALGKHSCYYRAGWHRTGTVDGDIANGNGRVVNPTVMFAPEDGWISHPGFGSDDDSPKAPGHHEQWSHPTTWANKIKEKSHG
jgi:hypothetical protein